MNKLTTLLIGFFFMVLTMGYSQKSDTIVISQGNIIIHFYGHASLMFEFNKKFIYTDPYSNAADYGKLPKANLILITHHHGDHFDTKAIDSIYTADTKIEYTQKCKESGKLNLPADVMNNGDKKTIENILIEAVPAYNLVNMRSEGNPYHPKGEGNGYVITLGSTRIYVAGDTEDIPEMKDLGKIDIAFLPMNLPYTMTPEMTANAARMVNPSIFYPYHFGSTDTNLLLDLLKNEKNMDIRIRDLK